MFYFIDLSTAPVITIIKGVGHLVLWQGLDCVRLSVRLFVCLSASLTLIGMPFSSVFQIAELYL